MFKEIEKIYKEKSEFNIITRTLFKIYWGIIGIVWLFGIKSSAWLSFFIIFIMILIMLMITAHRLKVKIVFNKKEKKYEVQSLRYFICKQEYELMKKYLLNNKMMNIEVIKNIIYHYRKLIQTKVKNGEFISIFTLLITILFSVIDDNGFKIDIINKVLPFIFGFLVIYSSYKMVCDLTKTLKGESGMYERLEEIFSEILVELTNNENNKIKSTNSRAKKKKM